MEYIVSTEEMRLADRNTSAIFGLSEMVLMERAALACVSVLTDRFMAGRDMSVSPLGVLIFAGSGGNGGDGIAVARLLHQRGCQVLLVTVGEIDRFSEIATKQLEIAMKYEVPMIRMREASEAEAVRIIAERRFDVIVDAIFGIGVSRPLSGVHAAAVAMIQHLRSIEVGRPAVVSIDMPSGIHTDTGEVCGIAVQADLTVTMNHKKLGLVLYPGAVHAGEIVVADVGITAESFADQAPAVRAYCENPSDLLPARNPAGNKGTFGKLLIVAGNTSIGGAPILAARAAFAAGAGMVRVFTAAANRIPLLNACPEALIDTWEETDEPAEVAAALQRALAWSNACVIGPGIGTGETAACMLKTVLENGSLPLIIDADGCNLIAEDPWVREALKSYSQDGDIWPVLTPHPGEFAGLAGLENAQVRKNLLTAPKELADELNCTVLCKDARSITAQAGEDAQILNLSGNCGMATAGSGDVLSGIAGALACAGMGAMETASVAAYLHGLAGDRAAKNLGTRSMTAMDEVSGLRELLV